MVFASKHTLGDYFVSSRKKGHEGLPILSVTMNGGLVHRDTLDRRTESNLEASKHLLVERGDIAYNMMRMWQGAFGRADKEGLVSPAYVVLRAKKGVDSRYANQLFKSARLIHLFWAYSYGLTKDRLRLYPHDFKQIPCDFPDFKTQSKTADILEAWDKAITTTERLLANAEQQKRALMQQLLTGKRRLPGFAGNWSFIAFTDGYLAANSGKIKSSEYQQSGDTPVVDQGKNLVAGYVDRTDPFTDLPAIIFGDHTRCVKWVDFPFFAGADGTRILKTTKRLSAKFGYYVLLNTRLPDLGYSRHMRELKEREFKVPEDVKEQEAIAEVLSASEQRIVFYQRELDLLRNEKKALMQQLLTGKRRVKVDSKEAVHA